MSPSLVQAQPASSGTLEFGPDPGRVPNFDLLGGYGRQSVSLDDSDTELAGGFVFTFADRDGNIPADEEIRIRGAGWSSVSPVVVSEGTVTANLVDFDLNRADTDEIDQIVVEPAGNYRVDFVSLDLGARVPGGDIREFDVIVTDAAGNETNVYDRGVLTPPYEDYLSEREIDLSSVDNATKVTITFDGGLRDAVLDNLVWENAHPPNTAPTFTAGPSASLTVDEDAAATSIASQLEVDDPDDGQTLTWSVASGPSHGTLSGFSATAAGGTAIEPSGITYTPNADYSGSDSFDIQVSDGTDTDVVTVDVTVTAVPDLTITDGTASNLDFPPDVEPGTDDNPVGIFALSGGQSGALFEGVTITNTAPGVAGISVARLYWSDDQTLEPGSDTELGAVTTDASSAPSTVSFSGFSEPIPTSARYAILAIDVTDEASDSGVQFELSEPSDLSVPGGEVAVVNGSAQDSFAGLLLSNESAALPVEMAGFDAEVSGGESVNLQWQTASEMNNAGFYVERKRDDDSWSEVGFVERQADGGTTTEVQSYRFVDADVPFAADSLAYRLRQVDTDGTASYTEPVTVARSTVEQVRLLGTFPNPARSRATVRLAVPEGTEGDVRLCLYDVLGRAVRTVGVPAEVGRHALTLETAGLPSGTYFLRLAAGAVTQTKQVTVVQ